ncbi:MAG: hypothetical protein LBG78_03710, partial [Azoarcus sp.]|nr:hypothetical protein [Azoarcus sp.]
MVTARTCLLPALVASALLAGCAGNPLRSYDKEMGDTLSLVRTGELNSALAQLDKNNTSKDKDILYYLEKGEVLYLSTQYGESLNTWLQGDEIVRIWEDEFKTNPTKFISNIASFIVNDSTRRYDGQDYEKVFLNTKLALDHILLGNDDLARIEMKKTFERETLIKQFREMEYEKIKEEGDKRSIALKPSELLDKGYPMDRLDNPEVNTLKNGYQNAFAHYLAGYYFEMMG